MQERRAPIEVGRIDLAGEFANEQGNNTPRMRSQGLRVPDHPRALARDRPDTLRLRASWGARRFELAAAGAPAIVVALVAAVAGAVALWFR